MALAETNLTSGQSLVIDPLLVNLGNADARLKSAQADYDKAVLVLEEYLRQSAEKLSIDIVKDYAFDLATKKFIDRSIVAASAEVTQPAKP